MEFSRDGRLLACSGSGTLELWDWRHNKRVAEMSGHGRGIESMAFSPDGRLAEPSDVAAAIAFFLSDDASHITGQTLRVDGGLSLI